MDRSDRQLIAAYLDGKRQSLDVLVARYFKQIYGFAVRWVDSAEDAEDITQETFVKAWRHLKRFDTERNFKTWLFAIARNTARDFVKKKKAAPFSAFETDEGENILLETLADSAPLPDEMLERKDMGAMIKKMLKDLSPKQRHGLALRFDDDLTFRAIADILAEPLHTVKSRNRRALAMLRKILPRPL